MDLPQDFAAYLLAEMDEADGQEYVDRILEICEYHSPERPATQRLDATHQEPAHRQIAGGS